MLQTLFFVALDFAQSFCSMPLLKFHRFALPPKLEELQDGSSVYVPAPDQRLDQLDSVLSEFKDLKEEVEALRYQVRELTDDFREFRKQFE